MCGPNAGDPLKCHLTDFIPHFLHNITNITMQEAPPPICYPQGGGAKGAIPATVMNNYISLIKEYLHVHTTWFSRLYFWIWGRWHLKFQEFCPLGPHGHHRHHSIKYPPPTHNQDSYQVWITFDPAFWSRRQNTPFPLKCPSPPPQICYSPQGPKGSTLGSVMSNFYSSLMKVSKHDIAWLFYF